MSRNPEISRPMSTGNTTRADVVVVGAGPAGLMAALAASERGSRVLLCEQLERVGIKLLATGGGHCNLSNTLPEAEFMARFGKQGRFMHPALKRLGQEGLRDFLKEAGVPTHTPDGFKVFPVSHSARSVQDALVRLCRNHGVELRTDVVVRRLITTGACVTGVETRGGALHAPAVILATGGKSYRELGSTGAGLQMAQQVGHHLIKPLPALVPLIVGERWISQVAGVSLPEAQIEIHLPKRTRKGVPGNILFTHRGLSGPAALDLSGDIASLLEKHETVPICLDLLSPVSLEEWEALFDQWRGEAGRKKIANLLDWKLPSSLARVLCDRVGGLEATTASSLSRDQRQRLIKLLTSFELTVTATEGFEQAMVTRGGISLKEVSPDTLESRIVKGLFFAGEILDLDGPSGGFNLQWAFSSGYLAGSSSVAGKQGVAASGQRHV